MLVQTQKNNVTVSGGLQTRKVGIVADAFAFKILSSGLYTDKVRAVIREYSTNAVDAHKENKVDRPFKVHLPTKLEPWFSVRDFGPGLNPEDLEDIYTTYFYSTKRENEEANGCLGLGTKSALALGDSFQVTTFWNGKKTVFSIFKDENGEPRSAQLEEVSTDEPSGLLVSVATTNYYGFADSAVKVYKYFDEVPEINDQEVAKKIEEARKFDIQGDGYAFNNRDYTLYARMANVAYPIPDKVRHNLPGGYIDFPTGSFGFNPGREQIEFITKKVEKDGQIVEEDVTHKILKERIEEVEKNIAKEIYDTIEEEETFWAKVLKSESLFSGSTGRLLTQAGFKREYKAPEPKEKVIVYPGNSSKKFHERVPLYGKYYKYVEKTASRVRQAAKSTRTYHTVLTEDQIKELKIDPELVLDPLDLPKVVRERHGSVNKQRVFDISQGWLEKAEVDLDEEFYYVKILYDRPEDSAFYSLDDIVEVLDFLKEQKIDVPPVYGIRSSLYKLKKFEKSEGIPFVEFVKSKCSKLKLKRYEGLGDNEDLAKVVPELQGFKNPEINTRLAKRFGAQVETSSEFNDKLKEVLKKYPLLSEFPYWKLDRNKDAVLQYIKAIDSLKGKK
jgi:hypothetical protein